jgi:hypothetical protein
MARTDCVGLQHDTDIALMVDIFQKSRNHLKILGARNVTFQDKAL